MLKGPQPSQEHVAQIGGLSGVRSIGRVEGPRWEHL